LACEAIGDLSMGDKQYCVYIMTNSRHTVLYTGVTNDLLRRVEEHKIGIGSAFTKKYKVNKLVFYEIGDDLTLAITREKQIKVDSRKKKVDLINNMNPLWKDYQKNFHHNFSTTKT
jgi:putative endonuclease